MQPTRGRHGMVLNFHKAPTARVESKATRLRTVLIATPYFPPSTLAGVHRARHLAKHLPAHGWRPIILRVDETRYTERPDPGLASLVPDRVEQIRTGAFPAWLARLAGVGDVGLRGYVPLKLAISKAAAIRQPDAILITGSPYYPMLLSGWVKRRLRIPVILDFQDPWVSVEGAMRPKWTKGRIAHQLAVALEPHAIRHADFITSVSDRQNDEMAERYPWLDRKLMAAIPIGGDPEDFDALRANPFRVTQVQLSPERINLSYVGTLLPRAGPLMQALLRAVRSLKQSHPELAAKLRLNFVGTSNQPDARETYRIRPIAEDEGVADLVVETPHRIPYLEALQVLASSNGLLLVGSDEPHYTASKIYPALMSGRPYISLFHSQSSAHSILAAAGGGKTFSFSTVGDLQTLVAPLRDALVSLSTTPEFFGRADPAAYAAYTAHSVAGDFARVFEKAAMRSVR
jgi:Glycosyl transferase 4-like domain